MIKVKPTYILACLMLAGIQSALSSCSSDDKGGLDYAGCKPISFIPTIDFTRGTEISERDLGSFQVTCFDPLNSSLIGDGGLLKPFFSDTFIRSAADQKTYLNLNDAYLWPPYDTDLKFFAYSTSAADFEFQNKSKVIDGNLTIDYKLLNFCVPKDIAKQFDFVTAYTSATNTDGAVPLKFKHQLSQIEIRVCGSNPTYNIEFAGVRIGNPETEGNFDFSSAVASTTDDYSAGSWNVSGKRESVSYIYQSGDVIRSLTGGNAVSQQDAFSIMGNGGNAMVIPTTNGAWGGTNDPKLQVADKSMYLSVLINISVLDAQSDRIQLYPAMNAPGIPKVKTVTLVIDNDGKVRGRKNNDNTYSDNLGNTFKIKDSDILKQFAWAAVPISADWKSGKKYVYTLDYTDGAGIQEPEDPNPGEPVIEGEIKFNVTLSEWKETVHEQITVPGTGEKDENNENSGNGK